MGAADEEEAATSPRPSPKRRRVTLVISDSEDEGGAPEHHPASARPTSRAPIEATEDEGGASEHHPASASPSRAPARAADGTAPDTDIVCDACGSGEQGETILLCDGCDAGWHMDCLEVSSHAALSLVLHVWFCSA